ncbi:outer membrane beta-barrel protein [Nitrospira sp. M1]
MCLGGGITEIGWAQVSPASYTFSGGATPFRQVSFLSIFPGTGLNAGPLRLHPSLGVATIYSDNIFRTDTRRRDDVIHTISPGLQVILPLGTRYQFVADYRATQHYYYRFSENNVLSQEVMGQLNLDFPIGLEVDLKGGHIEGFDQRGSEFDLQQRELTTWNTNSLVGQIQHIGPQMGFRMKFFSTNWNFENNGQAPIRNLQHTGADATLIFPVFQKTAALLSVEVNDYDFNTNNQLDSFSYTISTGVELAPTSRISGEFRVGYQVLNFDRAPRIQPANSPLSEGDSGRENIFLRGDLNWNPTSRLHVNVSTFRGILQSGVFRSSAILQTGVSLRATQKIGDRISLRSGMLFVDNTFDNQATALGSSDRQDKQITGRLGLDYRTVKWLGLRFEYIFRKRSSNIRQFDYYANTFMLSLQGVL